MFRIELTTRFGHRFTVLQKFFTKDEAVLFYQKGNNPTKQFYFPQIKKAGINFKAA